MNITGITIVGQFSVYLPVSIVDFTIKFVIQSFSRFVDIFFALDAGHN